MTLWLINTQVFKQNMSLLLNSMAFVFLNIICPMFRKKGKGHVDSWHLCVHSTSSMHFHFPKGNESILVGGQINCHMLSVNRPRYAGHLVMNYNLFFPIIYLEVFLVISTSLQVKSPEQYDHFAWQMVEIYVNFNRIP